MWGHKLELLSVFLRSRVCRTLYDPLYSVFPASSDGKIYEKVEGTFRDAY